MSNERPIGTGIVTITSDYQYILEYMKANMLKFQADFSNGDWTRWELDIISHELENTAKFFAEEQGLNNVKIPDVSVNGTHVEIETGLTGNLYNSIKSHIHGESVVLSANARNSRGQFYAGHIEYGFHDRGGNFIEARPFLRPALYAVSESSKGRITSSLKSLLNSLWEEGGYMGWQNITSFGRLRTPSGGLRNFYKQPRYGEKSGRFITSYYKKIYSLDSKRQNARIKLREGGLRKGFSANRYDINNKRDKGSFLRKTTRTKPRIMKNKASRARSKRKAERRKKSIELNRNHQLRKSALRKMNNLEPMTHEEKRMLTKKEYEGYHDAYYESRSQAGLLRDYKEERARAEANRQEAKESSTQKSKARREDLQYEGWSKTTLSPGSTRWAKTKKFNGKNGE